ncbi:hypothetical protein [Tuanshanicoccus lijuaniae]|uniref:hypothetical protein n=1 Tax=Aerococcaceae bacterium zg-1292 TaxID=2774330 RepID=UPI001BD8A72C|nr:hypothetical protein [Aerococcaceae bacterium zg-BR9]MBF6978875.1 hypothetical protein [Aerococcaceae bacterium zg-BR22]MBS4455309.1 hypothetical protein [Aerococcaceae bacterium zg-A91]MBS4457881.1 hypothetical protein [Aerococcaceae bacterium zg-BR33]
MRAVTKYLQYLVIVLAVIIAVLYVMNVNQPYYQDMNTSVLMVILAAVFAATLPLVLKSNDRMIQILSDVSRIIAPTLIIFAGIKFLSMRVESFGYIFASNLEAGNDAAMTAAVQAVWLLVLFVITWIISVIVSFFKINLSRY